MNLLQHLAWFIPMLFLGMGIYGLLYTYTIQHENTHLAIMKQDGCRDVKVEIMLPELDGSYTMCLDKDYRESQTAQELHGMNEIISYNNFTIMCCILMCTLYLGVFLMNKD